MLTAIIEFGEHPDLTGWMLSQNTMRTVRHYTFPEKIVLMNMISPERIGLVLAGQSTKEKETRFFLKMRTSPLWESIVALAKTPFYEGLTLTEGLSWLQHTVMSDVSLIHINTRYYLPHCYQFLEFIFHDVIKQVHLIERTLYRDHPERRLLMADLYVMDRTDKNFLGERRDVELMLERHQFIRSHFAIIGVAFEDFWKIITVSPEANLLGHSAWSFGERVIIYHSLQSKAYLTIFKMVTHTALDLRDMIGLGQIVKPCRLVMSIVSSSPFSIRPYSCFIRYGYFSCVRVWP
jgi:hypothetical protein